MHGGLITVAVHLSSLLTLAFAATCCLTLSDRQCGHRGEGCSSGRQAVGSGPLSNQTWVYPSANLQSSLCVCGFWLPGRESVLFIGPALGTRPQSCYQLMPHSSRSESISRGAAVSMLGVQPEGCRFKSLGVALPFYLRELQTLVNTETGNMRKK